MNRLKFGISIFWIFVISLASLYGASGKVSGVVKDHRTAEALPGANIYIEGTSFGAATNSDGEYYISGIPFGEYKLITSYIGYKKQETTIIIENSEKLIIDIDLYFESLQIDEVVVTAQLKGQMEAINQQLRSNTIKNIVSAERIQELPDANAAESVGRLPGISIKRSGGEADKIVIRGLAPTYNTITINGDKIPATDLDDRGVDLNMISPEILDGIEVTKALTPDMDADAIGGTVNFKLADAPAGGFKLRTKYQGSYNGLRDDANQYKASITLSNRFWDEKLGIMVTGNIQKSNRGSDQFNADYRMLHEIRDDEDWKDTFDADYVSLKYIDETRNRTGSSILLDYKLRNGKIVINNFMSRLDRHEIIRRDDYNADTFNHSRRLQERIRQIDILTNSVSGEHKIFNSIADWRFSRSTSLTRHPFDSIFRFRENGAFDASLLVGQNSPEEIINAAYNDIDESFGYKGEFYTEKSLETNNNMQFNFKIPYTVTKNISGDFKFGGKYLTKQKDRDKNRYMVRLDVHQSDAFEYHHTDYGEDDFEYIWVGGNSSIFNYIDEGYSINNFMGGRYDTLAIFDVSLDSDELKHFLNDYLMDSLYYESNLANLDDYETREEVSAGYIMTQLKLGSGIMFMPGVRYEKTSVFMTGRKGNIPAEYNLPSLDDPYIEDTTATNNYENWFPMVHFKLQPTRWFDIRLAYTKSQSRPQLNLMLPKEKLSGTERSIELGQPFLKPQISTNYDLVMSIFANKVGLMTIAGFYKEIDNLIFEREGHMILEPENEGYPQYNPGWTVSVPENNKYKTEVKGYEIEWQTNLNWMPKPLSGFVLNFNYSHIWSETKYPRSYVHKEPAPPPVFEYLTIVDTFRVGPMPDQPANIANIAIGYDIGGLSLRLSMLFQGKTLSTIGERKEYDGYTGDLFRLDMSSKYKINDKISLFYNINNLTNALDESFQSASMFITSQEMYGWTMDFGIDFKL